MNTYPSSRFGSEHPTLLEMELTYCTSLEAAEVPRATAVQELEPDLLRSQRGGPLVALRALLVRFRPPRTALR